MRKFIEYTLLSEDGVFAGQFKNPTVNTETGRTRSIFCETWVRSGLMRVCLSVLAIQIAVDIPAVAESAQAVTRQVPALMDRNTEIALALSACPPSVGSKSAVYVLGDTGYVKVQDGQNGFTAIVQHSLPTSQEPQCMDAEGTRTFLPRILKVAELRAQGKGQEEIRLFVAEAIAKGIFQPPRRPGVDYMLSTQNLVPDDQGVVAPFPPHVMFYAPYLTNDDLGSNGQTGAGPAFVAAAGTPYALIIVPLASTPNAAPHVHPGDSR